jgi:fructokinase
MTSFRPLLCGVELGGTKCICILGTGPADIREQISIPTTRREETLARINSVLDGWQVRHGAPRAIGLASFGPIDLRCASPAFGYITSTTKAGWENTDIVGAIGSHRAIPVGFNTDVNGAALAEGRWGAACGLEDFAYITVGTGVGVGLVVRGRTVFGCNHTELGHVRAARCFGDRWPGICPFHGDCIEGLASGPAIEARSGLPASRIAPDDPIWEFVAHSLAQLLSTLVLSTAPRKILVGGGVVANRPELLRRARGLLVESLNGYLNLEDLTGDVQTYVVAPGLGAMAGPLGALALAEDALARILTSEVASA